jgi:transcriptional regulator with XRE-family HTH domain
MGTKPRFDVAKMRDDMTARGWLPTDLAKAAQVSDNTVARFLSGERRNPRTAEKLAAALGRSIRRYLIPSGQAAGAEA